MMLLAVMGILILVIPYALSYLLLVRSSPFISINNFMGSPLFIFAWLFITVVSYVFQAWSTAVMVVGVADETSQLSPKEILSKSLHYVRPFIWTLVLIGGVLMTGAFLIVPIILFSIWFSLVYYIIVCEGARGLNALYRSREYIRGRFFTVLWYFICIGVIGAGLFILLTFFLSQFGNQPYLIIIVYTIFGILSPLGITFGYRLYRHLLNVRGPLSAMPSKKWNIIIGIMSAIGWLAILAAFAANVWLFRLAPTPQLPKDLEINITEEEPMPSRVRGRLPSMQLLQQSLESYAATYGTYPVSLTELQAELQAKNDVSLSLVDPETGEAYDYQIRNAGYEYTLCPPGQPYSEECISGKITPTIDNQPLQTETPTPSPYEEPWLTQPPEDTASEPPSNQGQL